MNLIAGVLLMAVSSCVPCATNAARILGIFPFGSKSHFNYNHAIMRSLHTAGHQITMITPFPSEEEIGNFTYVDSAHRGPVLVNQPTINELCPTTFTQNLDVFTSLFLQYCHDIMKLPLIQEAMNSPERLYDLLFVELFQDYPCYLPIAEKLGIPVIGTMTMRIWQHADQMAGAPNNPAVVPVLLGTYASEKNFIGRVQNIWKYLLLEYYQVKANREVANFYKREHLPENLLHKKDISLIFYNSHPSVTSRPLSAKVIEVGGIHTLKSVTKPLPKDLQAFIDEAPHGVILFTFGSMVRSSSMSAAQKDAFIAAFASIPQRVIWKFEEPIENLPRNVMVLDWLPQSDILRHQNVIAFMSHCGLSGMYEAITAGTPVVTIPLCVDQEMNAVILQNLEIAVDLRLETVSKSAVLLALDTIINDTRYYQKAQELSRVFKDRPMAPEESVVYWTNYVLEHNGAPHLKVLGSDVPFHQFFMLDIVGLAFLALSLIVLSSYWIIRKIFISLAANRGKALAKKRN